MNWIISLFHVFLLFLALWWGYWWFALFITPFFLFSLFLWFSSTYQSLSWLFGFFLKKTSNNEKAQIIHSISTPQSVYILLLFGWYLLLVSGYHNWIDPTLQVYVLSILVSGYIAFIWYCFSFFLEFSFGDKIDRILLNVTYVTSMVSLWLSILLVVLSFSQNSFSILFIAWFLCGVLCLICSNIYHRFFHLIQEQWMIFFSFIVILLFGVFTLFQFGIHFFFGAQFLSLILGLVSLFFFSSLSRIARLSSTFFEIGYYGVTISIFLWLTVLIFSPELFIHSSLLLLVSFFCGWFLYIRFHVSQVFFTYILTNYFFLLIFLFHFSVSGAWIYFFFAFSSFVLVFFIPQFFPFVLRVQEQLFLVIMSLVLFFWWFLFSAIFLTGFSLFGIASTLILSWLLLALVYGKIKLLFPHYDFSSPSFFRRR